MAGDFLLDGVIGAETIDSSGEVLDVKGADVSSLEVDGVLNWEHRGDDAPGASPLDIIGRCIKAKKVFTTSDCASDRERMYWKKAGEVPFIYGVFRLTPGHAGAEAAIATIRDQVAHGEDLIMRFSIEGSTLEKDGNVLKRTVARRVALTVKPCNKAAVTGVLHDPEAKEKSPDPLAALEETLKAERDPMYVHLGAVDNVYVPFDSADPVALLLVRQAEVKKAITAGSYNVAPGGLTGGAALQREDLGGVHQVFKSKAKAALRDYDPAAHGDFRAYLKNQVPEASDEFIEMFDQLADEMNVKGKLRYLAKKGSEDVVEEPEPEDAELPEYERKDTAPKPRRTGPDRVYRDSQYRKEVEDIKAGVDFPPKALPPSELPEHQVTAQDPGYNKSFIDEDQGVVHVNARGFVRAHKLIAPSAEEFHEVLAQNPHIQDIHDRAMRNWVLLHRLVRKGQLPPEVIAHAAMFSAMSPNTPVHIQELAYAFAHDLTQRGFDPAKEYSSAEFKRWEKEFRSLLRNKGEKKGRQQVEQLVPHHMREFFSSPESGIWRRPTRQELKGGKYKDPEQKVRSYVGLDEGKWEGIKAYHEIHGLLDSLVKRHGADGQSISGYLNNLKADKQRLQSRANTAEKAGKPAPEDPRADEPAVRRFAPKTIRYLLGMLGMGNVVVPDTHFLRHTFGLMPGNRHNDFGDPRIDDVKASLLEANREPLLQGVDRWYQKNHPSFAHTRKRLMDQYGEDFGEHATFPAFWLHWLTIAPHERMRGWPVDAMNEGTDHLVLWNAIHNILEEHGLPHDPHLLKGEKDFHEQSLAYRAAAATSRIEHMFGYTPAALAFHAFILPALLDASKHPDIKKAERLTRNITVLTALLKGEVEVEKPRLRMFRGAVVEPGEVEDFAGKRMPLLGVGRGPNGWHHVEHPDRGLVKVKPNAGLKVLKPPRVIRAQTSVDVTRHAIPHHADSEDQQLLVHGIDFARRTGGVKQGLSRRDDMEGTLGWYESASGHLGLVKPASAMDERIWALSGDDHQQRYTSAHREAAFHMLARDVFDLGEHVPVTAAFLHPVMHTVHSVQQQVPNAAHFNKNDETHWGTLAMASHDGTLDKLALMDMVLNQGDRHRGNYMMTPEAPYIHLIDNGLSLAPFDSKAGMNPDSFVPHAPHYWSVGHTYVDGEDEWADKPLNPEAVRWVQGLDPGRLQNRMHTLGVPNSYVAESVRRLTVLKARVGRGAVSRGAAYFSPFLGRRKKPTPLEVEHFAPNEEITT